MFVFCCVLPAANKSRDDDMMMMILDTDSDRVLFDVFSLSLFLCVIKIIMSYGGDCVHKELTCVFGGCY